VAHTEDTDFVNDCGTQTCVEKSAHLLAIMSPELATQTSFNYQLFAESIFEDQYPYYQPI
jgi:hypothetical protein